MKFRIIMMICLLLTAQPLWATTYIGETHRDSLAGKNATFVGLADLKDVSFKNLFVIGPLVFKNLKVQSDTEIVGETTNSQNGLFGDLKITGAFNAENIKCNELQAVGIVKVMNLKVSGRVHVEGSFEVSHGELKDVVFGGGEIKLDETELNNLIVKKDPLDVEKKQTVYLTGHTLVKGDITFESTKGVVKISPETKVMGYVKGAVLEKT